MTDVHEILGRAKEKLISDYSINTVTSGSLSDVDLTKTSIFPLAHIILEDATINSTMVSFNLRILVMDVVDQTNDLQDQDDQFYGNDNTHFVLNTQFAVLNNFFLDMNRGSGWALGFRTDDQISAQPFLERFENVLAGWVVLLIQMTLFNG